MLSSLFIAASIASISYRIFEQACVGVQIKIADGLAAIAAKEIKPAQVDAYSLAGKPIEPIIADETLTVFKPVYDAAGNAAFYIVMVDINYLKRVNENLLNASRLICAVCRQRARLQAAMNSS